MYPRLHFFLHLPPRNSFLRVLGQPLVRRGCSVVPPMRGLCTDTIAHTVTHIFMQSHTRQKHAMTKPYAILTAQPIKTYHRTHTSFQECLSSCITYIPPDTAMQVTSHGHMIVTVWPPPTPSTPTLWHHTHCLQLSGSLGRVELSRNNQPILGPPKLPRHTQFHAMVPTPTMQPPTPASVRHNSMWMHSLTPHDLLSMLEGNRQALAFLGKSVGPQPFQGIAHRWAWPHSYLLPPHCSWQRGRFGARPPLAGSLGAPLRLRKEIWPQVVGGSWVSQDRRPRAGRGHVVGLLSLPVSPSCSELGG